MLRASLSEASGNRLYTVLYDSIKQHMDIYVLKTNSTRRRGTGVLVSCLMEMGEAPSAKDAEHFCHVAPSREVLIENTLKCPLLNAVKLTVQS